MKNEFNMAERHPYRIKYRYTFNRRKEIGSTVIIAVDEQDAKDMLNDRLVAVDDLEILEVRDA